MNIHFRISLTCIKKKITKNLEINDKNNCCDISIKTNEGYFSCFDL